MRLRFKNLGKRIPEADIREELEAFQIHVQAVMQFPSQRRDQDAEKDNPVTPQFIVSVARGPGVARVLSLTELCGLRVNVETCNAPKGPLQYKRCQRFGHMRLNCGHAPMCGNVGTPTHPGSV